MPETLLVLAAIALSSLAVWAYVTLGAEALLLAGFWAVAAGLGFGLPTGLVYHLALRRSLAGAGVLPPRWWLHPTALHALLPAQDAFRVLLWCRLGAAGCALAFFGCAVFALGALRLRLG